MNIVKIIIVVFALLFSMCNFEKKHHCVYEIWQGGVKIGKRVIANSFTCKSRDGESVYYRLVMSDGVVIK